MTARVAQFYTVLLLVLIASFSHLMAGTNGGWWNTPRDYEPVVLKGENFIDFLEKPINELYIYTYNAAANNWHPIPFQFDQKDDSSHFWVPVPNDTLDLYDELVFMAKDMGDKAPDGSYWIDDLDSKNYNRVEISATDSASNKKGWIYLYRSKNILPLAADNYVSYKPDNIYHKGADTLIAKTYIESHDSTGIPIDWKLPQGSGLDILDRQKVLIKFKLYGWVDLQVREDFLGSFFKKIEKKVGPVRVVREVFWYINFTGIPPFEFSLPLIYYPYSVESGGVSGTLKASDHVYFIRQSFDLNPNANGMKFYNFYNQTGKLIDGVGGNDGVVNTLDNPPAVNWWLISGTQGSYAIVFRMSEIGNTRTLYYNDDNKVLKEGEDTGDMMSWGNTGIQIDGTDMAGQISFAYKAFYLGANQPYSLGDSLATNFKKPLQISTQPNYYVPVELAFFKAQEADGKALLEWLTQTESNNYGFEIHRKAPLNETWDVIASVKGQGTTTTPHKYSYTDSDVSSGTYYYRLKQIDFDGTFEFSDEIRVEINRPKTYSLEQNYPNPFNPETVIRYRIPELDQATVSVELKIYNLIGDEVKTLVEKDQGSGNYSVIWNGKNNQGEAVAAGTYIYRFRAGGFIKTNKMLLLR